MWVLEGKCATSMAYCSQVGTYEWAYLLQVWQKLVQDCLLLTMIQVSDRERFEVKVPSLALCLWK